MARKILLADDSVTAQNMGRKILADAGYEVVTVNNGSAALKKIAELKPDLVILDVYMPGYSGLEVCQRLKESQDSARIPVLLTVGKLEPFKPEEAQRVHAEAFIVKPFEASELLAALSKLEDKVVPRAEPSKPGRFARAIAAAEESGRISRNDTTNDDNGWKSRIGFPHEKTAEEKVADDATIYNPVNRDLRTVVETSAEKAAEKTDAGSGTGKEKHPGAETSVDVASLVPAGLPKDVTPEEVAAIAAAAARIHIVGATPEQPTSAIENSTGQAIDRAAENVQAQPAIQATTAPALDPQPELVSENKGIVATEPEAAAKDLRDKADEESEESPDVPVTMAAATASNTAANQIGARWTAVSVALEAEEATISLDQEMQKAFAAFVAEENASASVPALPDLAPPENFSAPAAAGDEKPSAAISNPEPEPPSQPAYLTCVEASEAAPSADAQNTPAADSFVPAEPAGLSELPPVSIPQPEAVSVAHIAAEAASVDMPAETSSSFAEPAHEPVAEPVSIAAETAAAVQELPPAPEPAAAGATASSHAFVPIVHGEQADETKQEPKEESEVKSTAAAWASWRQIRDNGDGKAATGEPSRPEFDVPAPAQSAAMAVAAGAEQAVQETAALPAEPPSDVASIVDSVLADLRPRLMAEITRKMAEKK